MIADKLDQVLRNAVNLNRKVTEFFLTRAEWRALKNSIMCSTFRNEEIVGWPDGKTEKYPESTEAPPDLPAGAVGLYRDIPIFIHPKEAKLNEPDNT